MTYSEEEEETMSPIQDVIDFTAVDSAGTYAVRIRRYNVFMVSQLREPFFAGVPVGQPVVAVTYERCGTADTFYALGVVTDFEL